MEIFILVDVFINFFLFKVYLPCELLTQNHGQELEDWNKSLCIKLKTQISAKFYVLPPMNF